MRETANSNLVFHALRCSVAGLAASINSTGNGRLGYLWVFTICRHASLKATAGMSWKTATYNLNACLSGNGARKTSATTSRDDVISCGVAGSNACRTCARASVRDCFASSYVNEFGSGLFILTKLTKQLSCSLTIGCNQACGITACRSSGPDGMSTSDPVAPCGLPVRLWFGCTNPVIDELICRIFEIHIWPS